MVVESISGTSEFTHFVLIFNFKTFMDVRYKSLCASANVVTSIKNDVQTLKIFYNSQMFRIKNVNKKFCR